MSIEEDHAWIGQALIEAERKRCVARVLSAASEDAVGKGDNYGSDLRRVKLSVLLRSGELQERSLIYKAMPDSKHRKAMTKQFGTFNKEAKVYLEALSLCEALRKEKEIDGECMWPEIFGAKAKFEGILFEDLSVKGFKMGNRRTGLDINHCILGIRSLAKFHALGAVVKENGDLRTDEYTYIWKPNPEMIGALFKPNVNDLADHIENKWTDDWQEYVEKLRTLGNTARDDILNSLEIKNTTFTTLNHGDCWLNNMMFRYGKDGKPQGFRFVDFQLSHVNHPGFDLQHFFQTSPDLEARSKKRDLLQEYYTSLVENLKLFGYEGKVPTYDEILEYYKRAQVFGIALGLISVPHMMAPPEKAIDMEEMSEQLSKIGGDMKMSLYSSQDENCVNTIKFMLNEAKENGCL